MDKSFRFPFVAKGARPVETIKHYSLHTKEQTESFLYLWSYKKTEKP